ncbi:MAG: hypothetical protein VXX97_09800 [Pseudomonadota bacterium]|nr:hypothetical protein [Pseudomonadota bacterium]MEC8726539.1 hypothetical protein [Pseudomonadota bacterium]
MLLCSELLKESLRQASGEKLICLKQLECAALGEETIFVDGTLNACIQRVKQANEKISSREHLKSTSELMTLAQFGGGSLGTAIGVLYNSSEASKKLEMLFIGKFLTHIIGQRETYSFLFPEKLLRAKQIERADISKLAAEPVIRELLGRAHNTLKLSQAMTSNTQHSELQTLMVHELKLLEKSIKVLGALPNINGQIELVFWDRLLISLGLLLKNR